jgi:hypothetical protein
MASIMAARRLICAGITFTRLFADAILPNWLPLAEHICCVVHSGARRVVSHMHGMLSPPRTYFKPGERVGILIDLDEGNFSLIDAGRAVSLATVRILLSVDASHTDAESATAGSTSLAVHLE